MKEYLRLFLIAVSFTFVLNVAQADVETRFLERRQLYVDHAKATYDNDSEAQFRVGFRYLYGIGVDEDKKKALDFLEKAAEQGHVDAQHELDKQKDVPEALYKEGLRYLYGIGGVDEDKEKALDFLEKAANKGDVNAQVELARQLEDSKPEEALKRYSIAAYKGHTEARHWLARRMLYGIGMPKNELKAHLLYTEIAKTDDFEARRMIAYMFLLGIGVSKDEKLAYDKFSQLAQDGDKQAIYEQAMMLSDGRVVPKNERKARSLLSQLEQKDLLNLKETKDALIQGLKKEVSDDGYSIVVTQSYNEVLRWQARELLYGIGVDKNGTGAYEQYSDLAKTGDFEARRMIAYIHLIGIGMPKNEKEAYRMYSELAKDGDKQATYEQAMMLLKGIGVSKNERKAYRMLQKLTEGYLYSTVSSLAQYELAVINYYGTGVMSQNKKRAFELLSALVEAKFMFIKYDQAVYLLAKMYLYGEGGDKDVEKALGLLKGEEPVSNKAFLFLYGEGEDKDIEKALGLLKKGVTHLGDEVLLDLVVAEYQVADKYNYGKGVEQDKEKAFKLYSSVVSSVSEGKVKVSFDDKDTRPIKAYTHSIYELAKLHSTGVRSETTRKQVLKPNKEKALKLMQEAQTLGVPAAMYEVALAYLKEDIEKESVRNQLFDQLFDRMLLGEELSSTEERKLDLKIRSIIENKVMSLLLRAGDRGYAPAQYEVGNAFYYKVIFKEYKLRDTLLDERLALHRYETAAAQGHLEAQKELENIRLNRSLTTKGKKAINTICRRIFKN